MMATLDGPLSPNSFNPLRYLPCIWVMGSWRSWHNWGFSSGAIQSWFCGSRSRVWGP